MKSFDQIFKVYHGLDDDKFKRHVRFQEDLGYEVVSTVANQKNVTVTYKRSQTLKFYQRLIDLESKLDQATQLASNVTLQISNIKDRKDTTLKTQKWIAVFIGLFLLLMDVLTIVTLIYGDTTFGQMLPQVLVLIGLHTLHVFWIKYLIRNGDIKPSEAHLKKVEDFIETLRYKAKKVSKEESVRDL